MTDSPRTGLRPLTGAVVGVVALLLGVGATLLFVGLRGDASPSRAGELLIVSAETAEVVGTSGDYSLALSDVDPQTLWFTDRPQRLSGVMSTNTLLEQWPQYFASSRPNAALTFQSPTGPEGQSTPIPVELGVPTQQDGTVRFPIQGLAGATLPVDRGALEGPRLFIDPPAARLTDFHESPMLVPSIPQIPDVGGPTPTPIPAPSIYIGGLPAAKIGDKLVVVGPPSSIIATPSAGPSSVPSTE